MENPGIIPVHETRNEKTSKKNPEPEGSGLSYALANGLCKACILNPRSPPRVIQRTGAKPWQASSPDFYVFAHRMGTDGSARP